MYNWYIQTPYHEFQGWVSGKGGTGKGWGFPPFFLKVQKIWQSKNVHMAQKRLYPRPPLPFPQFQKVWNLGLPPSPHPFVEKFHFLFLVAIATLQLALSVCVYVINQLSVFSFTYRNFYDFLSCSFI